MPRPEHVIAIVVTHNRRDLLVESIAAILGQTRPPDRLVVVDNASTDGTAEVVRAQPGGVELVTVPHNSGGAGGFTVGVAEALARDADLVWLMDDDTIPEPAALAALLEARAKFPGSERPTVMASKVVWTDGREHPMNTPRGKPGATRAEHAAAAAAGCVPVRSASFVSSLVDCEVIRDCGLPMADYFLWNDDFEFTTRLLRGRVGLSCPASVVVHKTRTAGSTDADPGDRFFYEVRNKVWLFTRSPGLAPAERALYMGSTLRRWARTFARSRDRATLRRELRRGLVAGVGTRPRPSAAVLADFGLPASAPAGPAGRPPHAAATSTPAKEGEA